MTIILCVGLSHHTAPVEIRERLHYSSAALNAALHPRQVFREFAILSTCNRTELYAVCQVENFDPLIDLMAETTGAPRAGFEMYLYRLSQSDAVTHLFRVAAGLDSMILGEPQILGQVTHAYETALERGTVGPILSALFRGALHTGKRARTETDISRNPASVSSIAVKLAQAVIDDLATAQLLIVGAGEMAELAVEALRLRGARRVTVLNRTLVWAEQLAARWGARAVPLDHLPQALAAADIVITSVSAPQMMVTPELVGTALESRPDRPLVFIDIAVPRNVDPDVTRWPNVHCFDIDDLESRLNGALAERQDEIPAVEAIVAGESQTFTDWLQGRDVVPVISDLYAKADAIRRSEVEKTLRHLSHLGESERRRIEVLTISLVNKLLQDPTLRLKAEASHGHSAEYAAAARYLFALDH